MNMDDWSASLRGTWAPDFSHSQQQNNSRPGRIDRSGSPGNPVFDNHPQMGAGAPPPVDGSVQMGTPEWAAGYNDYFEGMGTGGDGGGAGFGAPAGPMGGYVNPKQTYTGHTGYDSEFHDGVERKTPTGGGQLIAAPFLQNEEKILGRPDLQGTGREAFQASQFASTPQNPQAPAPNPTAEANARAQSLRDFDENRQRAEQQTLNAQRGN